jgi:hypothetical protein
MSMTRFRFPVPALAVLLLAACSKSDGLGPPVIEQGYFTYREPLGWTVQDYDLMNLPGCIENNDDFSASIEETDHRGDQSLSDFVQSHETGADFDPALHDVEMIDEKPFVTKAGVTGIRVVVTYTLNAQNLERVLYFFAPIPNHILVFTATCLAADAAKYVPIFDLSLGTLTFAAAPPRPVGT